MIRWERKMLVGMLTVIAILLFMHPALSRTTQEMEHEGSPMLHPCGEPSLDLRSVTQFFLYRWKASYVDLKDKPFIRYKIHIGELDNDEIELIRVFWSPLTTDTAVIVASHFQNFIGEQPIVDMYCIIRPTENTLVREYKSRELEKILATDPGDDV